MYREKILLGSASPRRKELLQTIWHGAIDIIKSDIEEIYPLDLELKKIPLFLANLKANDLKSRINTSQNILLTADTIVICQGNVLGKPKDKEDAKEMLQFLSGKVHQVITGVSIFYQNQRIEIEEATDVHFGILTTDDIDYYVEKYEPLDKAGSYGIQDFIGMIGIQKINGCYYNVMGLPTSRVWEELQKLR